MTENRRFIYTIKNGTMIIIDKNDNVVIRDKYRACDYLNRLNNENEQLRQELERCKDWIKSDKNDYELTLAFIKNKGYSLKDVFEYEKGLKE